MDGRTSGCFGIPYRLLATIPRIPHDVVVGRRPLRPPGCRARVHRNARLRSRHQRCCCYCCCWRSRGRGDRAAGLGHAFSDPRGIRHGDAEPLSIAWRGRAKNPGGTCPSLTCGERAVFFLWEGLGRETKRAFLFGKTFQISSFTQNPSSHCTYYPYAQRPRKPPRGSRQPRPTYHARFDLRCRSWPMFT